MQRFAFLLSRISFSLAAIMAVGACTPENTRNTGFLSYEPNPGYDWAGPNGWSYAVEWKAGKKHPQFAHISASSTPNSWLPDLGYDWVTPQPGDFRTVWKPGLRYDSLPHIASSTKEGSWTADAGYTFTDSNSLAVAWQPGRAHPSKPHFLAAGQEGVWDVEPGYNKGNYAFGGGEYAYWAPDLPHPDYPNVYTAAQEGYWRAGSGYRFASADNLVVEPIPFEASPVSGGPDPVATFVKGLVKAVIGANFSEAQPDDGAFASGLGRPMARALRDDGIDDMADALEGR